MSLPPLDIEAIALALRTPGDPQLAPDGHLLAYVETRSDVELDDYRVDILIVDAREDDPEPLARFEGASPRWSPDGASIAFVRGTTTLDGDEPGIWRWDAASGAIDLLAATAHAGEIAWSHDGASIAFVAPVAAERAPHEPIVIREPHFRVNGRPVPTTHDAIHALDVATGGVAELVAPELIVHSIAWSPTERVLAYAAGVHGHAPSHAYLAGADGAPEQVTPEGFECDTVAWTRDGRALVLTGKPDARVIGGRQLLALDLASRELRRLAPDLDLEIELPGHCVPGAMPVVTEDAVVFVARRNFDAPLYRAPLGGGPAELLAGGECEAFAGITVAGGRLASTRATPRTAGEVLVGAPDAHDLREITRCSGELFADFVEPEIRCFHVADGTDVYGMLLRRKDLEGPQPLVLHIHGGPHSAFAAALYEGELISWELAARGWNVLTLNPRGSSGRGDAFFAAVTEGWGEQDVGDFLSAIDVLVAEGLADPERLATIGYSYGGFMGSVLISKQDRHRFAAAVLGAGATDLSTMYGGSAVTNLMTLELGGAPPGRWELYDRLSPRRYADRVQTPALFLHGETDETVPLPESEAFFTLLRDLGKEAELVIYPGCDHLWNTWPLSARFDYDRRQLDWLTRHVGAGEDPADPA